jgi:hypothetical protein
MSGQGWRMGQNPPAAWHQPYLSLHPEWTPIWLVAAANKMTPEELLARIRPGQRKIRDIDEMNILYDFIKEHLATFESIKGKDVAFMAGQLGLFSLSGADTESARERSYILKKLVTDGYAQQVAGRFKGSTYYIRTPKLIEEYGQYQQKQLEERQQRILETQIPTQIPTSPSMFPSLLLPPLVPEAPIETIVIPPEVPLEIIEPLVTTEIGETPKHVPRKRGKRVPGKGVSRGGEPLQQILALAEKHGGKIEKRTKHYGIRFSDGKLFTIPGTPSDYRSLRNSLAEIRRYLRSKGLPDRRNNPYQLCARHARSYFRFS